jgi:hypothetical protein
MILSVVPLVLITAFGQARAQNEGTKPIAFADVPQAAHDAALKYLGREPSEARLVTGTNPPQYEIAGTSKDNRDMTVRVLGDGTIVQIGNARQGSFSGK